MGWPREYGRAESRRRWVMEMKDYIANKCVEMVVDTAVWKAADVICYLKKHDFSKEDIREIFESVLDDRFKEEE